jgi:hypothetical protein
LTQTSSNPAVGGGFLADAPSVSPTPVLPPITQNTFHYAAPVITYIVITTKPQAHQQAPLPILSEPTVAAIPSATGELAVAWTLTEFSAAQQYLARDTGSAASISAMARDFAFQEFTPTLLMTTAGSSYDRVDLGAAASESGSFDMLDGFIRPGGVLSADDIGEAIDALSRERQDIEKLLEELRAVDESLPAAMPGDVPVEVSVDDQWADLELEMRMEMMDDLPGGAVVAGMVLLQPTGDANESGFDLAPLYVEQIANDHGPAEMETSIGVYQAVDVVVDEQSLAGGAASDSMMEIPTGIPVEVHQSASRESPSANEAAVLVGATTVGGALVWMHRNRSRSAADRTAQKRRA